MYETKENFLIFYQLNLFDFFLLSSRRKKNV